MAQDRKRTLALTLFNYRETLGHFSLQLIGTVHGPSPMYSHNISIHFYDELISLPSSSLALAFETIRHIRSTLYAGTNTHPLALVIKSNLKRSLDHWQHESESNCASSVFLVLHTSAALCMPAVTLNKKCCLHVRFGEFSDLQNGNWYHRLLDTACTFSHSYIIISVFSFARYRIKAFCFLIVFVSDEILNMLQNSGYRVILYTSCSKYLKDLYSIFAYVIIINIFTIRTLLSSDRYRKLKLLLVAVNDQY